MKHALMATAAALLLTACGVDGEPKPKTNAEPLPETGISVTGRAEIGIAKSNEGK